MLPVRSRTGWVRRSVPAPRVPFGPSFQHARHRSAIGERGRGGARCPFDCPSKLPGAESACAKIVGQQQAKAALEHVAAQGAALGIDPSRLAVAGDSAGGNMAIAVTMMAKERHGPQISHQLLFYPVTDDVSDNASYRAFGNGPFLTRKAMDYFLEANYPAENRQDVLAFPLRASLDQLAGLPAATIIVAENDLLRDEGEAYGRRLIEAGVPVATARYNGTIHDFVMLNSLAASEPARAAIAQGAARLRSAFAH